MHHLQEEPCNGFVIGYTVGEEFINRRMVLLKILLFQLLISMRKATALKPGESSRRGGH